MFHFTRTTQGNLNTVSVGESFSSNNILYSASHLGISPLCCFHPQERATPWMPTMFTPVLNLSGSLPNTSTSITHLGSSEEQWPDSHPTHIKEHSTELPKSPRNYLGHSIWKKKNLRLSMLWLTAAIGVALCMFLLYVEFCSFSSRIHPDSHQTLVVDCDYPRPPSFPTPVA